jgi:hypothetical protein
MQSYDGTVQMAWRELRKKWLDRENHYAEAYKQLEGIPELTCETPYVRP